MTHKRCCIVGTAPSWRRTPWQDPTLEIWSLNDAYALGLPRASRWFEQHPLDKLWYRPIEQKRIDPRDVPKGHYIRPEGHLAWLKQQAMTIPVFLQDAPPADWPPNAHRFPIERVTEIFGASYWASGPSYMLAQAVLEGYTEIWITGIHLSTEAEYREQRPQFENLIGRVLGAHVKEVVKDGWRVYDGAVRIVLPVESPILQHGWRYAYEEKPRRPPSPYHDELVRVTAQKQQLIKALVHLPVGQDKTALLADLEDLEVIEIDCQEQLRRAQGGAGGTLTAALALPVGMGG